VKVPSDPHGPLNSFILNSNQISSAPANVGVDGTARVLGAPGILEGSWSSRTVSKRFQTSASFRALEGSTWEVEHFRKTASTWKLKLVTELVCWAETSHIYTKR